MRPGAGQRNVQVVTTRLGGRQRVAPLRVFTLERAVLAVFIPLVMPATVDQQAHDELLNKSDLSLELSLEKDVRTNSAKSGAV